MLLKEAVSWKPDTDSDRRLVQRELSAILSSPHFGNSKRYPAFLRYVVEKTLDGQADQLKERTLGVEVFDRRPDYDTNTDPVVRFSASEVRKRLAQFYHERNEESELQIDLPLGFYAPVFRMKIDTGSTLGESSSDSSEAPTSDPVAILSKVGGEGLPRQANAIPAEVARMAGAGHSRTLREMYVGFAILALGVIAFFGYKALHVTSLDRAWEPLIQSSSPVLIVVGSGNLELPGPESAATSLYDHMVGPYHHVSVSSAVAISRLTNVLHSRSKSYSVKEADTTSLGDMRDRPVILVGALNNAWTLRLIEPMRFRFVHGPMARIEDRKDPGNTAWSVNFNQPFTSVSSDYAIVARYRDASTNGNIVMIAGLGPYGTEAASDFLSSPKYTEMLEKRLPKGLKGANLEFVIKTDVIAGEAGPPYLVAVDVF